MATLSPDADERDVAPRLHMRRDEVDGLGVVIAQEFERPVREDDAEAPGGVGGVLLEEATSSWGWRRFHSAEK